MWRTYKLWTYGILNKLQDILDSYKKVSVKLYSVTYPKLLISIKTNTGLFLVYSKLFRYTADVLNISIQQIK